MTREEAIQALKDLADMNVRYGCDDKWIMALHMAIESLSADAIPQSEQYKKGFEDAKRAFELEYARESENMRKRNALLEVAINAQRAVAKAVQGYTEWLEKIIVEAETFEWLCENTADEEWCEKNCNYPSTQAECLRHLYEVSKGGTE